MALDPEARFRVYASIMTAPTTTALRIGDLASQTGVTVETLRYYETRGLLRPAGRRTSGYREYPPDATRVVRFIKRAQALGFSLAEVNELVRLREAAWAGDGTMRLRNAAAAKLDDIEHRLRDLHALRDELGAILAACDATCADSSNPTPSPAECPLVEALDEMEEPPKLGRRSSKSEKSPAKSPRLTRRTR
jgi:DNA-binding transcriptional MerR regulator